MNNLFGTMTVVVVVVAIIVAAVVLTGCLPITTTNTKSIGKMLVVLWGQDFFETSGGRNQMEPNRRISRRCCRSSFVESVSRRVQFY